jgi:hypothetical protein
LEEGHVWHTSPRESNIEAWKKGMKGIHRQERQRGLEEGNGWHSSPREAKIEAWKKGMDGIHRQERQRLRLGIREWMACIAKRGND